MSTAVRQVAATADGTSGEAQERAFGPGFVALAEFRRGLCTALDDLGAAGDTPTKNAVADLREQVVEHAPRVGVIGQVKAGKTALVNALAGTPSLLPSDVNPWTSAVTFLHLNQPWRRPKALFRFFGPESWAALVEGGGRLGSLARRAELADEAAAVEAEVRALQANAAKRLGRQFDKLVGHSHGFDAFDADLVSRYVCAGDDEDGGRAGRYAELTRSADLELAQPACPIPMTLIDTPGVNDTLLVREQLTLDSLAETDVCIIVLSAHQALTSIDVTLLRLLAVMRDEQLVLFVNRVDELEDPERQTAEISERIDETLRRYDLAGRFDVIFGSAVVAMAAAAGEDGPRAEPGFAALRAWRGTDREGAMSAQEAWSISGLPDLLDAVATRLGRGSAAHPLAQAAMAGRNLAVRSRALREKRAKPGLARSELTDRLYGVVADCQDRLQKTFDRFRKDLRSRLDAEAKRFAEAECRALEQALADPGPTAVFDVDTNGLRTALSKAYEDHVRESGTALEAFLDDLGRDLAAIYVETLGHRPDIRPPLVPVAAAPVALGGKMAIDAEMPWWRTWFGRARAVEARVQELNWLILSETRAVIDELCDQHLGRLATEATQICRAFLEAHVLSLLDHADAADTAGDPASLAATGNGSEDAGRRIERAIAIFDAILAERAEGRADG